MAAVRRVQLLGPPRQVCWLGMVWLPVAEAVAGSDLANLGTGSHLTQSRRRMLYSASEPGQVLPHLGLVLGGSDLANVGIDVPKVIAHSPGWGMTRDCLE